MMRFVFILICAGVLAACAPSHPAANSAPLSAGAVLPTPLMLPSDAPPQILAVQLSDAVFHSGETVSGTVVTSTNVAGVQVEFAGRSGPIPQREPGIFALSYTLPNIPFFLRGVYTATILARNAAGITATRAVSVTVR